MSAIITGLTFPIVLNVIGALFVLLGIAGNVETRIMVITLSSARQRVITALGIIFVLIGVVLYVLPGPKPPPPTPAPITCADYDIKITSPSSNTPFEGEVVEISGSYSVKPPGEIVLLTIVPPGGHDYWPQDPVRVNVRNKSWRGTLMLVGEPPIKVDAMVAIMGESGRALYDYYCKVGEETGEWPAIEKLTDDIVECDRITVVRTK